MVIVAKRKRCTIFFIIAGFKAIKSYKTWPEINVNAKQKALSFERACAKV